MTNRVRFDTAVNDQVSGRLDRIKAKFQDLGKTSAGQGVIMGASAAAVTKGLGLLDRAADAALNVLKDSFAAAQQEEISVRKLDAALRANIENWDGNTDAIEKTLAARMRLGFADDEQRESLAVLTTVTKDATKALDLQRTAMDLARLRNMDLGAASELLGKVYAGNTGILSRYGIQLAKGTSATEAIAEIQRRARGQAEAYANTNEGKLLASQIKVGEAMEKLGAILIPIAAEVFPKLADAAVFVVENIAKVGDVAAKVLGPLAAMNDFIGAIPGPWHKSAEEVAAEAERIRQTIKGVSGYVSTVTKPISENIAEGLRSGKYVVRNGAVILASELPTAVDAAHDEAVRIARKTPGDIAEAIRNRRAAWQDAVDQLGQDLENEMTSAAEMAAIRAALIGDELTRGLRSKDPAVKAQAQQTKDILEQRLRELTADAYTAGTSAGTNLSSGLRSQRQKAEDAAETLAAGVRAGISSLPSYTWGQRAANNYAAGLESRLHAVQTAASRLAGAVGSYLKVSSPAERGPLSTLGGPEGWGERVSRLWARGVSRNLPNLTDVLGGMPRGDVVFGGVPGLMTAPDRPLVIQLVADGRTLAEVAVPHLARMTAAAPRG